MRRCARGAVGFSGGHPARLREQSLNRGRIRFVDDDPSGSLTDALINAIDRNTAVVAISSVQFATGTAVNVDRVSKAVSDADGHLIVDVTQELGETGRRRSLEGGCCRVQRLQMAGAMAASHWP